MDLVSLYITAACREEALAIARALIEEKLAACVNVLDGVTSVYSWKGAMEEAQETALIAKTRAALADKAMARIRELHSYETPCIVAWPIAGGHPAYLDWIARQTQ